MASGSILSKVLITALLTHDRVGVKGIGSFGLIEKDMPIDEQLQLLAPPSMEIGFDTASEADVELSDYISGLGTISEGKKKKLLSKLRLAYNNFVNFGSFELDKFGTVELSSSGASVFQESPDFQDYYQSLSLLPQVEMSPLPAINDSEATQPSAELIPQPVAVKAPEMKYRSYDYEEEENKLWKYIVGGLLVAGAAGALWYASSGSEDNEDPMPSTEQEIVQTPDKTDSAETNDIAKPYSHLLTPDVINSGCVIITGTFSNESNAQNTIESIKDAGYVSYQENYNGLNRVGIRFDCREHDLDSMLYQVQHTLNENAWYLRPADYNPKED